MRRKRLHDAVVAWLAGTENRQLHDAAVTISALQVAIGRTRSRDPDGAQELEAWLGLLAMTFNVVAMDARTCRTWARLMNGRHNSLMDDAMFAATAMVHNMVVVTRNVRDFVSLGVEAINPFGPAM